MTAIPVLVLGWVALVVLVHRTSIRAVKVAEDGLELAGVCQGVIDLLESSAPRRLDQFDDAVARRWNDRRLSE